MKRANNLFWWALALVVAALPAYMLRFTIGVLPTNVFEVAVGIVFVWWCALRAPMKAEFVRFRPLTIPLILIAIGLVVGVARAPNTLDALGFVKSFFVVPIVLATMLGSVIATHKGRDRIARAFIFGGFLVVFEAAAGWIFRSGVSADERLIGLFTHPNYLGMFVAPFIPLFVWGKFSRPFRMIASALAILILVATLSRAALIASAIGTLAVPLIQNTAKRRALGWVVGLAGLGIVAAVVLIAIGSRVDTSDSIRIEIWRTTAQILRANPIWGIGLSGFQTVFTELTHERVNFLAYISPVALTPHNLFLAAWVQMGIFGFAGFITLAWYTLRQLYLQRAQIWTGAFLGAFIVILSYGMLDTPYFKNDLAALWWIVTAFALTKARA